jgi:hypothetical protein
LAKQKNGKHGEKLVTLSPSPSFLSSLTNQQIMMQSVPFMHKSMYVRVKRPKQTIFLNVEPSDSIATVKGKVSQLSSVPASNIRLVFNGIYLDDEKTIGDNKIENDNILFQIHKKGLLFIIFHFHVC